MEIRQLRAAVTVAERRHFGRAAAELGTTQPALSQAVKALEGDLDVVLFDRDTRNVAVTDAGAEFLQQARTALSLLDSARDRVRAAGRGEAGALAVGMVGSALLAPIPDVLSAYRSRYPDVRMTFSELTTGDQVERLRSGALDVGFLRPPLPAPAADELELTTVAHEPLMAVLPRGHRLAGRDRVPVHALAGEPFVRTPRHLGAGLHEQITTLCRAAGFEPRVEQEATQMDTVVGLVGAGFGVSIVPGSVAARTVPQVVFAPLSPRAAPVALALARPRGRNSPQVATFVALTRDIARVRQPTS